MPQLDESPLRIPTVIGPKYPLIPSINQRRDFRTELPIEIDMTMPNGTTFLVHGILVFRDETGVMIRSKDDPNQLTLIPWHAIRGVTQRGEHTGV